MCRRLNIFSHCQTATHPELVAFRPLAVSSRWNGAAGRFVAALVLLLLCCPVHGETLRSMPSHAPGASSGLPDLGRLDPTNRLHLAFSLPLRNRPALSNLLQDLYNPAGPQYRHFLSVEEFTERFGPTGQDYEQVIAFAQHNNLSVVATHPNRVMLDVAASVPDLEKAFHVRFHLYQHPTEARAFYAPDVEPSIDAGLPIQDIDGLDNFSLPHPISAHDIKKWDSHTNKGATPLSGSGPGGAFLANDLRKAYAPDVTLTGAGQSVALVQFDSFYTNDIIAYEVSNNLPNVSITTILLDGATGVPGVANEETSLDIEMAIAMAPGLANVYVYEAPNSSTPATIVGNANDMLNRIATDNLAKQISCSWSWKGTGDNTTIDSIFQEYAAQGQSFFVGSGDWGAYNGGINNLTYQVFDHPLATVCGGTTLTTDTNGAWAAETTWNQWPSARQQNPWDASGGGSSSVYPIPAWQQGVCMAVNGGSVAMRNTPDVAAVSDNISIAYGNGSWGAHNGTSFAAPIWAGFAALINEQAAENGMPSVGFLNPALYSIGTSGKYPTTFHDITTGNNVDPEGNDLEAQTQSFYVAGAGYDLCTGWGTPTGQKLIDALTAPPDALLLLSGGGFTASGPVGGPFNIISQKLLMTNTGNLPLSWSLRSTSMWLSVSATAGALDLAGSTNLGVVLNSNATALPAGIYLATVWITNINSGAAQSLAYSLQIGQSIVQNGGFESGDLEGWIGSGCWDDRFGPLSIAYSGRVLGNTAIAHSGDYVGAFTANAYPFPASVGTYAYLSQAIPTTVGQQYLVSFWLSNSITDFIVNWDGQTVFDANPAGGTLTLPAWTNMQFVVTASNTTTMLALGWKHAGYPDLDDISVTPVSSNAPLIVAAPNAQHAAVGDSEVFAVTATGALPLTYQWRFNGVNLMDNGRFAGSQSNILAFNGISAGDEGNYSLVVSNTYGALTGAVATLTVLGQDLLFNGGFESPVIASKSILAATPDGWNWSGNGQIVNGGTEPGYDYGWSYTFPLPTQGAQYANFSETQNQADSTLSQTFSIPASGQYFLEWFDSHLFYGAGNPSALGVAITNNVGKTVWTNYYPDIHGTNWQDRSASYFVGYRRIRFDFYRLCARLVLELFWAAGALFGQRFNASCTSVDDNSNSSKYIRTPNSPWQSILCYR